MNSVRVLGPGRESSNHKKQQPVRLLMQSQNSAPLREPAVWQVANRGSEKYPDLWSRFPFAKASEIRTAVTKGVEFC